MKLSIPQAWIGGACGLALLALLFQFPWRSTADIDWRDDELALLRSFWLGSLPPLPPDPSNRLSGDMRAARLGQRLFFDTRMSLDGSVSCASCHQPEKRFTDGLPTARALGNSRRNTPSLVGVAYSPWLYWDGRKDSLWSQALAPLEDPAEHGGNRMRVARLLVEDPVYRAEYTALFGAVPDFGDHQRFPVDAAPAGPMAWQEAWQAMSPGDQWLVSSVFANVGKALAAYQERLLPGPARFDTWLGQLLNGGDATTGPYRLTREEQLGLRLFIGQARCIECHNGPLFTNNEFHNTGLLPPPGELPDLGRMRVLGQVRSDPFNCLGAFSDADPVQCQELLHMREGVELVGALRTPSLRNLAGTAPYGHKGQFEALEPLLQHYNQAPLALVGHNEVEQVLGLTRRQLQQLQAFLDTLQAPPATPPEWLRAPGI